MHAIFNSRIFALSIALAWLAADPSHGQSSPDSASVSKSLGPLASSNPDAVRLVRNDRVIELELTTRDVSGQIEIPRIAAALRSLAWKQGSADGLKLTPEPDTWLIQWEDRPSDANAIELVFDSAALLLEETQPIAVSADGSFYLPAHLAATSGEKVRYEPQPFKNTVGYWTGKTDQASWRIDVDRAGSFNVAVLQGCGRGQGGSQAQIEFRSERSLISNGGPSTQVEFEVLETGHFQNFQWRHLGTVELAEAGVQEVRVVPIEIKKAALMDVRAVHLIRLPN